MKLLNLFPEHRDALDEIRRLREENLHLRTDREAWRDKAEEAQTALLEDRDRMINFLAQRQFGEMVFGEIPAPRPVTGTPEPPKPKSQRQFVRRIPKQDLVEMMRAQLNAEDEDAA